MVVIVLGSRAIKPIVSHILLIPRKRASENPVHQLTERMELYPPKPLSSLSGALPKHRTQRLAFADFRLLVSLDHTAVSESKTFRGLTVCSN